MNRFSLTLLAVLLTGVANPPQAEADVRQAVMIPMHGEITPLRGALVQRKFEEAVAQQPDMIILHIDSPGGYVSTTMELVEMLQQADVETVAFIDREALSGAALVAMAADRIVMLPRARIGDAGPIVLGPDMAFRYAPEKYQSVLVQQVRDIAEASGRPAALAEAMVDKDVIVFQAQHKTEQRTRLFTDAEWESLAEADQWEKGKPILESRESKFLTVNGQRAVELGLADHQIDGRNALADVLEVAEPIRVLRQNWIDTTILVLNSPWITGLLLVVGLVALLVELSAPGLGVGGLVSLLCFGLFFWSRFLGGTAGWLEVVLFLCGLAFIAAEVFVFPGFGIAGIGGGALLIVSLVMASRHVVLPESSRDLTSLGIELGTVLGAIVAFMIIGFFLVQYLGEVPGLSRLALQPPVFDSGAATSQVATPEIAGWQQVQPGDVGQTLSALRPSGKAQFAETIVDVVTEGDFVDPGQTVRVLLTQGTRVVVRQV